ncbi:unnamed protein product [Arctogadus glacialis]
MRIAKTKSPHPQFLTETERETGTEDHGEESMEEESSSSSASQMQCNDIFTREHTLFLIDLMRRHLKANGSELPQTLAELNSRIKHGKGSKKHMWGEMAGQLSDHFGQIFDPARLNRKWNTLVDGYKKIKDNNRSTGRGTIRFKFYNEMDALLGANHDVEFPVIGTLEGIQIRRPDLVNEGGQLLAASPSPQGSIAPSTVSTAPSTVSPAPSTVSTPRQRIRSQQCDVVELLRASESANERRHSELLIQMKQAQTSFEVLMREYLNKS